MARLDIDKLHSVKVENNRFLVKLNSGNASYELTLGQSVAGLLAMSLLSEAKHLPEDAEKTMIHSMGIQPIVGPHMNPGIELKLSDNLFLTILLGEDGLKGLHECVSQLESSSQPSPIKH